MGSTGPPASAARGSGRGGRWDLYRPPGDRGAGVQRARRATSFLGRGRDDRGLRRRRRRRRDAVRTFGGTCVSPRSPTASTCTTGSRSRLNLEAAKELRDAAVAAGTVAAVDAYSEHLGPFRLAEEILAEGSLGQLQTVSGRLDLSLFDRPTSTFPYNWFHDSVYGAERAAESGLAPPPFDGLPCRTGRRGGWHPFAVPQSLGLRRCSGRPRRWGRGCRGGRASLRVRPGRHAVCVLGGSCLYRASYSSSPVTGAGS